MAVMIALTPSLRTKLNYKLPQGLMLMSANCRYARKAISSPQPSPPPEELPQSRMLQVLNTLFALPKSLPFRSQLREIQVKLEARGYTSVAGFKADVRRVWTNVFTGLPPESDQHRQAVMLSGLFEREGADLEPVRISQLRRLVLGRRIRQLKAAHLTHLFSIVEPELGSDEGLLELSFSLEHLPNSVFLALELYVSSVLQPSTGPSEPSDSTDADL